MDDKNLIGSALPDYTAEITQLIRSNLLPKLLREQLRDYHENDIASALSMLKPEERQKLYGILSVEMLSAVLEYADEFDLYLNELPIRKRVSILAEMEVSAVTAYLGELDKQERRLVMSLLDEDARREIALLASFDKDEIGSKMSTDFIVTTADLNIRSVMNSLIEQAADKDNVSIIYVVDNDGTFAGAIDLKDLIRARSNTPLEDVIMTSFPYVYSNELISDCVDRIKGYSEDSIPVLDEENKLCGVLTAQDIAEMVEDEIGDDYAKLGGLSAEEDIKEPLMRSIRKRLPWLSVLLILGLLVSSVVGMFESVVSELTLIVSFQSLILGMAGNVGTQSLAVTIRSLADESLTGKQKLSLVWKEARVGLCNGLILGIISFLLIGLYLFCLCGETARFAFSVSMCTGIALFLAMFLSGISGTVIPILFKKLKIDPAVASGPFITTINDLVAVITYYGLAWLLLIRLLAI